MTLGACCGSMATFLVILGGLGRILGGLGLPLGGFWEPLGSIWEPLGGQWLLFFFFGKSEIVKSVVFLNENGDAEKRHFVACLRFIE